MDRGWKNFEDHNRKSLDFLEETVSRNMDIKDSLPVKAQKEVRNMVEKTCVVLENTQVIINCKIIDVKGTAYESSKVSEVFLVI